ncbi:MAG: O-antigen ligase family protein [Caldimicrobium sp.]
MAEEVKKLNKIFLIIFSLGWTLLWISLFFKHTRTLWWIGDFLLFFLLVYIFFKNKTFFISFNKFFLLLIFLFLLCLFPFAINSYYLLASFEAFLLNYFFHICIAFLLIYFVYYYEEFIFSPTFFGPILITNLAINLYYFLFVLIKCNFYLLCSITNGYVLVESSLLKGFVVTSSTYLFCFIYFLFLYLRSSSKRLLFLFMALFNLFFIFWLGRRAVLLALILSFFVLFLLSNKQRLKIIGLTFLFLIVFGLIFFFTTPWGKQILIRSDNLKLLFTFKYENFAKAGSFGMRLYIWPIYINKILEDPFSGTGLGRRVQKKVLSETNKRALSLEHAHNLFLNLSLQAGIHTALVFFIIYLYTLIIAFRLWKTTKEDYIAGALFLFLLAFFIISMFEGMEEGTRLTPFWIASGLTLGLWAKLNFPQVR